MPIDLQEEPPTYPMRVAARLTGLSQERLRAWETRYAAISPIRTAGGSRRYTDDDIERLRLLRLATEAGHRISDVAQLDAASLRERLPAVAADGEAHLESLMAAVDTMDASALRARLEERLEALGPVAFAREEALPLAREIGRRWAAGQTSVAAEHAATNVLRSLLVDSLEHGEVDPLGPQVIFAAPEGERHDLGVLAAAIASRAHGARPIFVGADVPAEDLVAAVARTRANALALGFVISEPSEVEAVLRALRDALPDPVALWIGGRAIVGCAPMRGVDRIEHDGRLEAFVLAARGSDDAGVRRAGASR